MFVLFVLTLEVANGLEETLEDYKVQPSRERNNEKYYA
jgi:hypothetical protein